MVDALRKLSTSYACPILHGLFEKLQGIIVSNCYFVVFVCFVVKVF